MFEGQPPQNKAFSNQNKSPIRVLDISYSFQVSNPIQIPIFLYLTPVVRFGVAIWKAAADYRGFLGCKCRLPDEFVDLTSWAWSSSLPTELVLRIPPPPKTAWNPTTISESFGTKINILKCWFADGVLFFFNEKKGDVSGIFSFHVKFHGSKINPK